jgi:hypothetical protein
MELRRFESHTHIKSLKQIYFSMDQRNLVIQSANSGSWPLSPNDGTRNRKINVKIIFKTALNHFHAT